MVVHLEVKGLWHDDKLQVMAEAFGTEQEKCLSNDRFNVAVVDSRTAVHGSTIEMRQVGQHDQ